MRTVAATRARACEENDAAAYLAVALAPAAVVGLDGRAAPGIDLPIATIMRSKYGTYPEYHTSLDKIGTVVTQKGLKQSFDLFKKVIFIIENNEKPITNIFCEPMLSKRNLYPTFSAGVVHEAK